MDKTINHELEKYEYSKDNQSYGYRNFKPRKDIIQNECNDEGTLIITVEIEDATATAALMAPTISYKMKKVDGNTIQWDMHIREFEKLDHKRGDNFMTGNIAAMAISGS